MIKKYHLFMMSLWALTFGFWAEATVMEFKFLNKDIQLKLPSALESRQTDSVVVPTPTPTANPATMPIPTLTLPGLRWSSVVRIESAVRGSSEERGGRRWGTGVVIGRYEGVPSGGFRGSRGLLVLTDNHVLLEEKNPAERWAENKIDYDHRVTFFTQDRVSVRTLPFRVYSTNPGEDLALLEVPLPEGVEVDVELPTLGLLEPSEFRHHQWQPKYTRMNPGNPGQRGLSFSYLSANTPASMVTQDAINSLAPLRDDFWYINNAFSPGMSGGPVYAAAVRAQNDGAAGGESGSQNLAELENVLVGVMGYIFNLQSAYGYAYPLTQKTLESFFDLDSNPVVLPFNVDIRSKVSRLALYGDSVFLQILHKKKSAPDGGVADEVLVRFTMGRATGAVAEQYPSVVELRQVNEFSFLDKERILQLLRGGRPNGGVGGNFNDGRPGGGATEGSPGGGATEGSPGGGATEGSPGGGATEGSPGGTVVPIPVKKTPSEGTEKSSLPAFRRVSFLAINLVYPEGKAEKVLVDSIKVEGDSGNEEERDVQFLKDILTPLRQKQKILINVRPVTSPSNGTKEVEGLFYPQMLRQDWLPLTKVRSLFWSYRRFKISGLVGQHGVTLKATTYFRDTQTGKTHSFAMQLGLQGDTVNGGIMNPVIEKFYLDGQLMPKPEGLVYRFEKGVLKMSIVKKSKLSGDHSNTEVLLEVKL